MEPRGLKKSLSQHLLKGENVLRKIVRISDVRGEDTVVEIGAGTGGLTRFLAERAGIVYAIEIDESFRPFLDPLRDDFENLRIIYGDFLRIPLSSFASRSPLKVVGNIPYRITGPLIIKLIKERTYVESAFLTVQKEVGERIKASPRTKQYGSLSVLCQTFFEIKAHFRLKPHLFTPPPSVESLFLAMRLKEGCDADLDEGFLAFVRSCFQMRRRLLRHALLRRLDEETITDLYSFMGFHSSVRAEEIEPKAFKEMYLFLTSYRSRKVS